MYAATLNRKDKRVDVSLSQRKMVVLVSRHWLRLTPKGEYFYHLKNRGRDVFALHTPFVKAVRLSSLSPTQSEDPNAVQTQQLFRKLDIEPARHSLSHPPPRDSQAAPTLKRSRSEYVVCSPAALICSPHSPSSSEPPSKRTKV